jgi:hypothetical protein
MKAPARLLVTLYRAVLRAYPADFRHAFAPEMAVVFADALADAAARGRLHLLHFCWRELRDLPVMLIRQHWRAHTRRESLAMPDLRKPDAFFYVAWLAATLFGYALGFALAWIVASVAAVLLGPDVVVGGVRQITDQYLVSLISLPSAGVSIGALQFVLLRRYLPRMGWWVAATGVGWLLASRVNTLRPETIWLTGVVVALPQWLLLRRRVPAAAWWIVANGLLAVVQLPLLLAIAMLAGDPFFYINDLRALALVPAGASVIVLGPLLRPARRLAANGTPLS